ncbi:MAG: penicillin acylase family protein [Gammaproteobacteria bacterium]|nr:penicillin acylase family protein [Gammaproteobacteria bacterium]
MPLVDSRFKSSVSSTEQRPSPAFAGALLRAAVLSGIALLAACAPATDDPQARVEKAAALITATEIARWEASAANVTIKRDRWGIPHIYGKTDADTVFGTLYAQAEDDFNRVETNYLNAMGRLAEAEGAGELYRDLRMKLFIDPEDLQEQYEDSAPWLRELMDAFADGLNYYLHTHPEVTPRVITRFEPWMALSFSEGSIGGDIEQVNLRELQAFYGREGVAARARETADASRMIAGIRPPLSPPRVEQQVAVSDNEPRGSNGFAIAPERSASGNALLWINPHTSFFFRSELHMVSEEGLNAYGAVTWGQFFVYQGFSDKAGWMHTSSRADAIDYYLETIIEREDGLYYEYDGAEIELTETTLTLPYREGDGMAEREFTVYHSHHGPIIRAEDGKWVSIKLMQEPVKALTQSYRRTKAGGHVEFYRNMRLHTNSSNNTVYADAEGNIAYYHGNFIPRRDLSFDWNRPLDGSDPATEWQGLHTLEESITLLNPPNGWIQNTNNWPFSAAGENSPRAEDYPRYMANYVENPRGVHAVRVLENADEMTIDSLIEAAYDPTLVAFEPLLPALVALGDDAALPEQTRAAIAHLADWNYQFGLESTQTSLAVFWGEALMSAARPLARAADKDIYDYLASDITDAQRLTALAGAVETLEEGFGSWQVPWGEINRYQRNDGAIVQQFNDSKPSLPVAFASARWGSLASFGSRSYPGTNRWYGTSGNSFVAAVEFGERVRARAVTVGGLSNDPDSTHFDDQAELYTQGRFRDVYYYPEDVDANLSAEYRPGE